MKSRRFPVRRDGRDLPEHDEVVVEEPLEIRIEGVPAAITMRTPGDDLDLAAGFLYTEGVIDGADDIRALAMVGENTVDVRLAEGVPAARARSADRALYSTSSCGICGIASIERLRRTGTLPPAWTPAPGVLRALPGRLRALQPTFGATGGLHAAALFDPAGELFDLREDIGRHNAVDKVIGSRVRTELTTGGDPLDFASLGLLVSSRAGFEIVQKALVAGIPVVAALGAPSSLAIETANATGMRLIGWLRGDRYTLYG